MKLLKLALDSAEEYAGRIKFLIGVSFINAILEAVTLLLLFSMLSSLTGNQIQSGFIYNLVKYFDLDNTIYQAIIILIAASVRYILGLWVEWSMSGLWAGLREKYQNYMFARHLASPLSYLLHKKIGEHIHNTMDVPSFAAVFYLHAIRFVSTGLMFIILLGTLFLISPYLFAIAAGIALVYGVVIKQTSEKVSYKMGAQQADAIKSERELATEGLLGIRYLKIFGMTESWQNEFSQHANIAAKSMHRAGYWNTIPSRTMEFLLIFVFIVLILYGFLYTTDITATIPTLAVYFLAIARLLPSLSILGNGRMQMMNALPNLERIIELKGEIPIEGKMHGDDVPPSLNKHEISFKNVSLSYGNNKVLNSINLQIKPNNLTVIIGATGHGKSTILDLLLRFIEPEEGEITINNNKINDFDLRLWWHHFSYVGQEPFIFQGSIRDNLCIDGNKHTDADIKYATELACIDDYIEELPEKLETVLSERGQSLSGGQKQRLAIARAFLSSADVIILDEPTSALDMDTESRITRNILSIKNTKTVVMVSHRLGIARHADNILVIRDGNLVEQGSFEELAKSGQYFRRMYGFDNDFALEV